MIRPFLLSMAVTANAAVTAYLVYRLLVLEDCAGSLADVADGLCRDVERLWAVM